MRPCMEGRVKMERKLLVTVGEDLESLYGVRFVASFFQNKQDIRVTLLYVAPRFESEDEGQNVRHYEIDAELSEIYSRKGKKALEISRGILESSDFAPKQITSKLIYKKHGMVADITEEAATGNHDVIVLGQRGYSIFEKALYPVLPSEMVRLEMDFPIWICKRPRRGLKNVLLCMDGSPESHRITDHVAAFVGREERHGITLFHVSDGSRRGAEILAAAMERLSELGIKKERMKPVIVESADVAKAINHEAKSGDYAVVAAGRRGIKKVGEPDKWVIGSNNWKLIDMLENAALWVGK